jgi:heme/copper-type cytochrome/quinol oxidase subunit 1
VNLQQTADTFAAKAASAATYTGSAGAIYGGLNDWNAIATIGGILIGLAGLALNAYFKWRHLKIAEKYAKADPNE